MPYKIRKAKCKQSDDTPGSYVLSYTDKRGKKHRACHTSKKKAKGQIAAIEMESLIRRTVSDIIKEELSSTKDDNHMKIKLSQLRKIIRETIEEVKLQSAPSRPDAEEDIDEARTMKIISLLYSDNQVGTHEYGFIPRKSGEDPDDEDRRYQRHLKSQGLEARVWDGKAQIAAIEMESLIRPDAEEDINETDLAEDEFTYAIAKAAAKGEKSVDIDGEKFPVKMSKEKAKDIVSKQK